MLLCGGSPLSHFSFHFGLTRFISCRGDYTGEEFLYFNSRSPLSEPVCLIAPVCLLHVGEITQGRDVYYSRSPLSVP